MSGARRRFKLLLALLLGFGAASVAKHAVANPLDALELDDRANRLNWMLQCQGCHRQDGAATDAAVPALAGQVASFLYSEDGRAFLVRVPGVALAPLDDRALASLLNWMLLEFDAKRVPEDFEPYRASEIHALRAHPLGPEVKAVRSRLIEASRAASLHPSGSF